MIVKEARLAGRAGFSFLFFEQSAAFLSRQRKEPRAARQFWPMNIKKLLLTALVAFIVASLVALIIKENLPQAMEPPPASADGMQETPK